MTSVEPRLWDQEVGECPATLPAIAAPEAQALAFAELTDRARSYARSSKAANTLRAYESDVRHFRAWCAQAGLEALPATGETVALDLTAYAGALAVSTLRRRLAAISVVHQAAGVGNPTTSPAVKLVWGGIRRTHGQAPWSRRQPSPRWWRRCSGRWEITSPMCATGR